MNMFSALDDSDDELPKVIVKPAEKKTDPAPSTKGKSAAPVVGKESSKPRDKKPPSAAPSVAPSAAASAPASDIEVLKENNRGGLAKGKGGRDYQRPRKEGDGEPRKREFDRRSGTGRGREVSRGGRGSFGLGNDKQDALEAEKDPKAAEVTTEAVDVAAEEEAVPEVAEEPKEPKEPEIPTYTMDQFMEKRNAERAKAVTLLAEGVKVRTVDKEAFTGLTVAGEDLDDFLGRTKFKAGDRAKDQRSTGKTQILDVGFKFKAPASEDRGDRGGTRRGAR
jgi:plasminogen activator inhibitor 1 RNA-binding protein